MGDKNTKFFQTVANIQMRHNYIHKILDNNGIWTDDQNCIVQVFTREFQKRFCKDPNNKISVAVPLSRDIILAV